MPAALTLTLLAVSLNERPLSQPITAHFDHHGGTIGRADHNTMALPDPERQISRLQAEIIAGNDGFRMRNVSTANPIVVGGRSLEHGESTDLVHGDEVRIGGYLLHVDCQDDSAALEVTRGRAMITSSFSAPLAAAPQTPAPRPAPSPSAPTASGSNPFADLIGGGKSAAPSHADPFADIFGSPAPAPLAPAPRPPASAPSPARPTQQLDPFADLMAPPAGVAAGSSALAPSAQPAAPRLPDDFDVFAPPASPPPSSRGASPVSSDIFADLMPSAAPASIDQAFGLGSDGRDPLADFMSAAPTATGAGASGALSVDPMQALFGDSAPAAAVAPAQADRLPAVNAAFAPPRALRADARPPQAPTAPTPAAANPPAPRPAQPVRSAEPLPRPAAGIDAADAQRLWSAFCQGAGIDLPLPATGGEHQMREAGRILRHAVDGALRLIAVRASTRHELHATVTVIQVQRNNPLKFSPDARSALESLLQAPVRGFLDGPTAMEDAMQDLVGHSIGTVAGMRAAIEGMLDRFAPSALEEKLTAKSLLDTMLPMNRRAKLWDLYQQHSQAIRTEAQEDFESLFGKAFLEAYERQVDLLRKRGDA